MLKNFERNLSGKAKFWHLFQSHFMRHQNSSFSSYFSTTISRFQNCMASFSRYRNAQYDLLINKRRKFAWILWGRTHSMCAIKQWTELYLTNSFHGCCENPLISLSHLLFCSHQSWVLLKFFENNKYEVYYSVIFSLFSLCSAKIFDLFAGDQAKRMIEAELQRIFSLSLRQVFLDNKHH